MISVPVSARREASAAQLGNHVGVVPVEVAAAGDPLARLAAVGDVTRRAQAEATSGVGGAARTVFRLLAHVGLFGWFLDRQRLVHTFFTNLHGPDERLPFMGVRIADVIALTVVSGNVTVSFAALSYAGTLTITIVADPDACGILTSCAAPSPVSSTP